MFPTSITVLLEIHQRFKGHFLSDLRDSFKTKRELKSGGVPSQPNIHEKMGNDHVTQNKVTMLFFVSWSSFNSSPKK